MKKDIVWTIAQILLIISLLVTLGWAIGKSIGWIHSPIWVSMIPIISGAIAIRSIGAGIGKSLQKIDRVIHDVEKNSKKIDKINSNLINVEARLTNVETTSKH